MLSLTLQDRTRRPCWAGLSTPMLANRARTVPLHELVAMLMMEQLKTCPVSLMGVWLGLRMSGGSPSSRPKPRLKNLTSCMLDGPVR